MKQDCHPSIDREKDTRVIMTVKYEFRKMGQSSDRREIGTVLLSNSVRPSAMKSTLISASWGL